MKVSCQSQHIVELVKRWRMGGRGERRGKRTMASMRLMNRRASFFLFSVNAGTSERKIVPYVEQIDKKSAVPRAF